MCLSSPEPAGMAEQEADEPSSGTESPDGESRVSEDKWSLHQRLAIRELIDTEVSYVHMLRLCALDIRSRLKQVPGRSHTQPGFLEAKWVLGSHSGSRNRFDGRKVTVDVKSMERSARPRALVCSSAEWGEGESPQRLRKLMGKIALYQV